MRFDCDKCLDSTQLSFSYFQYCIRISIIVENSLGYVLVFPFAGLCEPTQNCFALFQLVSDLSFSQSVKAHHALLDVRSSEVDKNIVLPIPAVRLIGDEIVSQTVYLNNFHHLNDSADLLALASNPAQDQDNIKALDQSSRDIHWLTLQSTNDSLRRVSVNRSHAGVPCSHSLHPNVG